MDRSILQKIRIWLNLHLKLNTSTNKDIQISEDPISCGKKGLLSFSYRSHFLSTFKMKAGYIPLENLVPLQPRDTKPISIRHLGERVFVMFPKLQVLGRYLDSKFPQLLEYSVNVKKIEKWISHLTC